LPDRRVDRIHLLTADYADKVGSRLHLALADLHNLAGWTSFDVGLYSPARRHFAHALEQAKHANDSSLVANVLYRMGRLHLHRGFVHHSRQVWDPGNQASCDRLGRPGKRDTAHLIPIVTFRVGT
jgi:hypothetical protein